MPSHSSPQLNLLPDLRCVLFDLDGTLLDTARDMVAILNQLLLAHGREAVPYDQARNHVSNGALALIRHAWPDIDDVQCDIMRAEYIERYRQQLARFTEPMPHAQRLISACVERDIKWGVVTNKPSALTDPLLAQFSLFDSACTVVSGDTAVASKPSAEPMLFAMKQCEVSADACLYVGDAERDIAAARAVDMPAVAVTNGYILPSDDVHSWQADYVIDDLSAMLPHPQ